MDVLVSLLVGVGLSAACGFRVFVPLLVMSIASLGGFLELNSTFGWIGTYYALAAFSVATVVEIIAFYVPWLDNLLDTVATPAAVVAGIVVTASVVSGLSPMLTWSLAIIAGGGAAGAVQGGTVLVRAASTATTGGMANPVVSTGELAGAVAVPIIAILVPVLAVVLVAAIVIWFAVRRRRKRVERARVT